MSRAESEELRARESVLLRRIPDLKRARAAAELEEDQRLAEGESDRLQAEAVGVLPGEGGATTLAPAKAERHDFDGEIAGLEARADEIGKRIGVVAVADAPLVLEDLANATDLVREKAAVLGEAAIPLFLDVLAALGPRDEALAAVAAVERDFRGPPKVVAAQRSAVKRYERDLLAAATQPEIVGLLVVQVLQWARRGSTPLEPTWREQDVPLLPGSVMMGAPVIGGVVSGGPLPL